MTTFRWDLLYPTILFGGFAAWFLADAFRLVRARRGNRNWPTVTGRIGATSITGAAGSGFGISYAYSWTVNGTEYSGHAVAESAVRSARVAEARARDYANRPIQVAYDPANPADHTIKPEEMGSPAVFIFLALLSLVLGAWYVTHPS